jgi:hypothetical protein
MVDQPQNRAMLLNSCMDHRIVIRDTVRRIVVDGISFAFIPTIVHDAIDTGPYLFLGERPG